MTAAAAKEIFRSILRRLFLSVSVRYPRKPIAPPINPIANSTSSTVVTFLPFTCIGVCLAFILIKLGFSREEKGVE